MENQEKSTNRLSILLRNNKIKLLALFCLFLLCLLILIPSTFKTSQTKKTSVIPTTKPTSEIETMLKVEQRTNSMLDYINTQRQPNGYYQYLAHYDEICREVNGKKECPFAGGRVFPSSNAWTALANFSGSIINDNKTYLNKAKEDIEKLAIYCKDKIDDCRLALVQPFLIYDQTKLHLYKEFILTHAETLLRESDVPLAMIQAIESRELLFIYILTGEDRYRDASIKRLEKAKNILENGTSLYVTKDGYIFKNSACWVTLAQASFGRLQKDHPEVKEAEAFLESNNVYGNAAGLSQAIEQQPCIDAYFELALVTGNETHAHTGKYFLNNFISSFWDSPEANRVWGEGGTASVSTVSQSDILRKHVNITDSAYTVYLLYRAKTNQ